MGAVKTNADDQPHPLDVALGQSVRLRRRALRMSQQALADAIGVSFQQVQKYERGTNRVSFSRLVEISHTLGCRVSDLVDDLDEDKGRSSERIGDSGPAAFAPPRRLHGCLLLPSPAVLTG